MQIRNADYAVKNDRFRHFLPFAENRQVLLAIAGRSFDAGSKEILSTLRRRERRQPLGYKRRSSPPLNRPSP